MITVLSSAGYADTVSRLLDVIENRGLTVFGRIDHAAAAREVGMELADEMVIIFGNPRAGTPLMQQDPRIGIELPLRMLVWANGDGTTLGYDDPRELSSLYDVGRSAATLDGMSSLLADLAREAAGGS